MGLVNKESKVHPEKEKAPGRMASLWQQLRCLLVRNILLKKREKGQLFQDLFFPVYFVAILAIIRITTKPGTKPSLTYPSHEINGTDFGNPWNSQKNILVSPDTTQVQGWMQDIVAQLPGSPGYTLFATSAEAEASFVNSSNNVGAGIIFNQGNDSMAYSIRMKTDAIPSTGSKFDYKKGICRGDGTGTQSGSNCEVNTYMSSGFVLLQMAIENVLIKYQGVTSQNPLSRVGKVQMMTLHEFTDDTNTIQLTSSLYFVFAFSFLASSLAVNIVAEKEKKIKDGLMMMGLRDTVFWLSWSIVYFIMVFIATTLVIIIIVASKFFEQSNIFLLYLMIMLYGCSFIALAIMITPFFNKAKVAGAVAGFSTIIVSTLYLAVSLTRDEGSYDSTLPAWVQWLMCLLSPVAFATAIDQSLYLDVREHGIGFDDSMTVGKFPLYGAYVMMFVDTILYALLTMYFDRVIPGEYGVRYPPHFIFMPSFWFPKSNEGENKRLISPPRGMSQDVDLEPVPANMDGDVTMRIMSLSKAFKADGQIKYAVDSFCLDIYQNQITCLLGHNGAGKTTLINMLTGVVPPSSGTAKILDYDVTNPTDMNKIRQMCGICPQHNILYDKLSCREHLEMFAGVKGVPRANIPEVVVQALRDVDLENQIDTFAKDLSGGQKRKLSVAIALIGDPKLIFLDEPTAGMDPYSRRHLWSLLKKRKEGRVILLTTHFMDEADILADRKAFIRKGQLRCCGSSLFLKNKFGVGYHLTMVVNPTCNVSQVTQLLQSFIPGVEHHRSHGKELAYTVPIKDVSSFPALFDRINASSSGLGIISYGVSMTTLEEVFLKLEDTEESDELDIAHVNTAFSANQEDVHVDFIAEKKKFVKTVKDSQSLSLQRFKALFKIRFLNSIRSPKTVIVQILFPVALVLGGLFLAKSSDISPVGNPTLLQMQVSEYCNASANSSFLPAMLVFDTLNTTDSNALVTGWESMVEVYKHYIPNPSNITYAQFFSNVYPHYAGLQIDTMSTSYLTEFVALYNMSALHAIPVMVTMASQSMLTAAGSSFVLNSSSYPWPETEVKLKYDSGAMWSAMLIGLAFLLGVPSFAGDVVKDRELKVRSQLRISSVSFNIYWSTFYLMSLAVYVIPCVLVLIVALAMQIQNLTSAGAMGALVLMFLTNIPFNMLMAFVLSFMFKKAEVCSATLPHLLNMASLIPYMVVSLVDLITQSEVAIVVHYLACIFDPPYIIFGGFYFINRIGLMAYIRGQEVRSSEYFEFDNHVLICIIIPIFHAFWMYWLLRVLDVKFTGGEVREAFPCCSGAIDKSSPKNSDRITEEDSEVSQERANIEKLRTEDEIMYSSTGGMTEMQSKAPVAFTSQVRKEFVKRGKQKGPCQPRTNKTRVAVRNLSIGVNEGEVLGLLGPNGAGKSTALNMLIAETKPTCGKVNVSGHNIRSTTLSLMDSLGYCPQHDALWETITLAEHIRCFAAIKGIEPDLFDEVIQYYVNNLKLSEHKNKHAKKLSGGTKRKLSYILSILGRPHLVLLDEPSTGMDPQSKRFLWDTISSNFQNTEDGAILTTHYMEEADALCDRVGIMVNGQLQCLGSTQHLKDKFGSGYILEIKLKDDRSGRVQELMDELEDHLKSVFPHMEQVERFMERAQYSIPKEDVQSLGKTFSKLEACKVSHGLEEYSFSQSSLEQVFLYFAKQQIQEGEVEDKDKVKRQSVRESSNNELITAVA